jgi:5-methyltetrahydrofolate--homocysteine methyltransferase
LEEKKKIKSLLRKRIVFLDGATGTELQKRGMPGGVSPELWSIENPEALQEIHASYVAAGSDIVYTCTFGANWFKLSEYGKKINVPKINKQLVALAKRAVGNKALVAGTIGPTGHFVEPFGALLFEDVITIYKQQVRGLLAGGVDLIVIETMMDIQEARAALLAVKEMSDIFTIVTMTYESGGRTLNGTDTVSALITLQSLGADAVGCNCSVGPKEMLKWITKMKPYAKVPLVAKPNAGLPKVERGITSFDMSPKTFGGFGKPFVNAGVNFVGGCCGTTPNHIQKIKENIKDETPRRPVRKSLSAVSSVMGYKILDHNKPLFIVGERINPTGKKTLQLELMDGKTSLIRKMAREQESQGADLLDVNIGVHGINETKMIKNVVQMLSLTTALPLVIDSSKVESIEMALRYYPGRALINSISGEKERLQKLLPIAAKYGAMFILLPLMDHHVPKNAEKRISIIENVFQEAQKHGYTKEDIIVDGLVMTIASEPRAALESLKTIRWCAKNFKCRSVLGLSNVSFGMPERKWLNSAFLAMAQAAGLTMVIANPASEELMAVKMASDFLMEKDENGSTYIRHFMKDETVVNSGSFNMPSLSPSKKLYNAIIEGNRDEIISIVDEALQSGRVASVLVDEIMIPAIEHVGELFNEKTYFLPQLIASAETMKKAMGHIESNLASKMKFRGRKGNIILATVKGDIHDIGKNIVALLLKNHGYNITDLGKDVSPEKIINAIKKTRADIVGLSALMTTTMANMKDVIDLAKNRGLRLPFIVGGAVVTEEYAKSIGAAYAKDGVEAVKIIAKLINYEK